MDTPVFKLYLGKLTLDGALLPQECIADFLKKSNQFMKDAGARSLITGMLWSDECYRWFGAEWFPSWKALREHDRCLDELNLFQYIHSEIHLGVEREDFPISLSPLDLDPATDWIANIYMMRLTPAGLDLTDADIGELMKVEEQGKALGARNVLSVFARPANEEWDWWGIELYPKFEAVVAKTRNQEKVKWWKYVFARSYLGTPTAGELIKK